MINLNSTVMLTMFRPICPLDFFMCFMSNMGVDIKSWTEPFIWNTSVHCSNSVNYDHV